MKIADVIIPVYNFEKIFFKCLSFLINKTKANDAICFYNEPNAVFDKPLQTNIFKDMTIEKAKALINLINSIDYKLICPVAGKKKAQYAHSLAMKLMMRSNDEN